MSGLKDKVAIITGASSGIGEEIAYFFASNGFKLSLIGRNKERLENVVANCLKEGIQKENVIYVAGDLTNGDVRKALIDYTITTFRKIDILKSKTLVQALPYLMNDGQINNAGISTIGICADTSEEDYRRIVETNQTTPFLLTRLAIPYLKESKGNIVNISSIAAIRMTYGLAAYSMSKATLNMFTQCLSVEMARYGVRVNSLSPGAVQTRIGRDLDVDQDKARMIYAEEEKRTPLGRNGKPREIAEAVGFLASDKSSWITGENLVIDGGCHVISRNLYVCDMKYKQQSS